MAVTAATPPSGRSSGVYPGHAPTGAPPPPPPAGSGTYQPNLRIRWANWMEKTFGKAYVPIAMAGGAVIGGGLGALTLGPIGGIAGAVGGALLGGVLVFAG